LSLVRPWLDNNYQIQTKVLQYQILILNHHLNKAWTSRADSEWISLIVWTERQTDRQSHTGQPRLARTALLRLFELNQRMNEKEKPARQVASNGMRLFIFLFSPSEGTRCHVRPVWNWEQRQATWQKLSFSFDRHHVYSNVPLKSRNFIQEFHRNHKSVHFRTVELVFRQLSNRFWVHTWHSCTYALSFHFSQKSLLLLVHDPYSRQFLMAGKRARWQTDISPVSVCVTYPGYSQGTCLRGQGLLDFWSRAKHLNQTGTLLHFLWRHT